MNDEQIRQQAHYNEIDGHIKAINRIHILLASNKTVNFSKREKLQTAFDELNGWAATSLKRIKSMMGCA